MAIRVVEKLTHQTNMTAEVYLPKPEISSLLITYFKYFIYARSSTEGHRDTQTSFSWFIDTELSLRKRSYRSFILSSTNVMELSGGIGIFRLSFVRKKKKI